MILLMGIAGSGKGTQGKMLADQKGLHLISMGDVVRMYVTGEQRQRMLDGGLLNDQEVIDMLDKLLATITDHEGIILDGFPRTIPQAEWLLQQVQAGRFTLKGAVHLVASREAVKERLLGRARIDDNEAAIEKRFDEYERSTTPLLEWLTSHNVAVLNINAEQSVEAVNSDITKQLAAL